MFLRFSSFHICNDYHQIVPYLQRNPLIYNYSTFPRIRPRKPQERLRLVTLGFNWAECPLDD